MKNTKRTHSLFHLIDIFLSLFFENGKGLDIHYHFFSFGQNSVFAICNLTAVFSIVCIGNLKCGYMLMENSNTINNFGYEIVG